MCTAMYKCISTVFAWICVHKRWYTHAEPVIRIRLGRERRRRGCEAATAAVAAAVAAAAAPAAAPAPARMLLLFAKRCIILSAMSGISKRNTSGFAIVLRICSPIQFPSCRCAHRHTSPSLSIFRLPSTMHYLVPLLQELHRNWSTLHVTGMHDSQITRKPSRRRRHPGVSFA